MSHLRSVDLLPILPEFGLYMYQNPAGGCGEVARQGRGVNVSGQRLGESR
ncbi:hypothetical protein [Pandoraea sputorum]|nr:hypothetical protein [Pandoraea sputorum]